jgi:hypothetical protein
MGYFKIKGFVYYASDVCTTYGTSLAALFIVSGRRNAT